MADNITLNPGASGDVIAADEISGVKHQRVKIEFGPDGSATEVAPLAPLPVATISGQTTVASGSGAIDNTTQRVVLATDDAAASSLGVIDDWDESDRAKVNPIVGQAGVASGNGTVGNTTQRVVLATDDAAVSSLGVIDDWDESDRAKVNPIVGQAGVSGGSGVVDDSTQRVVLATNVGLPAGTASLGKIRLEDDLFNKEALISPTRQLQVASGVRLVGSAISGSVLDTNFWTATTANSATVTQSGGVILLTSGTDADGLAQVQSVRVARHVSSNENYYRALHRVGDTGTADNLREWGVQSSDGNDAALFRLSGTTFQVITKSGGSQIAVSSGSFNGDGGASYSLNTNVHTYQIWYLASAIRFIIDDVLIHTISATSTRLTQNTNFKIHAKNLNSGNTTSVTLETWVAAIVRLGEYMTRPHYYNLANVNETRTLKGGPGSLHRIVVNDANASGTLTLYDNTSASGTKIATIAATDLTAGNSLDYGLDFFNGLTYVSDSSPGDFTFVYE
jgi:hypothetical protein